jgi:hypothetical protein
LSLIAREVPGASGGGLLYSEEEAGVIVLDDDDDDVIVLDDDDDDSRSFPAYPDETYGHIPRMLVGKVQNMVVEFPEARTPADLENIIRSFPRLRKLALRFYPNGDQACFITEHGTIRELILPHYVLDESTGRRIVLESFLAGDDSESSSTEDELEPTIGSDTLDNVLEVLHLGHVHIVIKRFW